MKEKTIKFLEALKNKKTKSSKVFYKKTKGCKANNCAIESSFTNRDVKRIYN